MWLHPRKRAEPHVVPELLNAFGHLMWLHGSSPPPRPSAPRTAQRLSASDVVAPGPTSPRPGSRSPAQRLSASDVVARPHRLGAVVPRKLLNALRRLMWAHPIGDSRPILPPATNHQEDR